MLYRIIAGLLLLLIALMSGVPLSTNAVQTDTSTSMTSGVDAATRAGVMEAYGKLPLLFIKNQGQLDNSVAYYVKTSGQTIYLTTSGMVFDLFRYEKAEADLANRKAERLVFSLDFVGVNESSSIQGGDMGESIVNYFIGNDPDKWLTDIPTYRDVVYSEIYPGVDFRLYGKGGVLEYDFVVQPGVDVNDISLAYNGVDSIGIESGELVVDTAFGELSQSQPYIYQRIAGAEVAIEGGFRLLGDSRYGFRVAAYDAGYPLVIDPSILYSTYLGGGDSDYGNGIAVESGYAYVTGYTLSTDFPTRNWYMQDPLDSNEDVFVTKIDTSKSGNDSLIYSTYLGGSGGEEGEGIAVEGACAYVTGWTTSTDFPTKNWYHKDQPGWDAFVTRLNSSGNGLVYSTYIGGDGDDRGYGVAVESGHAYVTGCTYSTDFPTVNQYQGNQPDSDVFVTRINTALSGVPSLVYSTYLGGSGGEDGEGIAVEGGCAYVVGFTESTDFPTRNEYQADPTDAGPDAFITKINTAQSGDSSLVYSTYLGGGDDDKGHGIAVESGCAYVTGYTGSLDFPTTPGAYDTVKDGTKDAFVAKFDTAKVGSASRIYSSFLGGGGDDEGNGIAVESGYAYVAGLTESTDFPTRNEYQTNLAAQDAFVTKVNTSGSDLAYSTYLGGNAVDVGNGIAVESGYTYITGFTWSTDFPTENEYQTDPDFADNHADAFITRFTGTGTDGVGFCDLTGDTLKNKFYLRANDGTTTLIKYKKTSDLVPITGDWNGDGIDEVGFCDLTGDTLKNKFYLRNADGITTMVRYKKLSTYTPITGDWNGDGIDEVGFCDLTGDTLRNKFYLRNADGTTTIVRYKKLSTYTPITGDWNGDGIDEVGFCDLTGDTLKNRFYLRKADGTTTIVRYKKLSTYTPITGDWNGDGVDEVGFCDLTGDTLKNKFYLRNDDSTTTLIKYKKDSDLLPVTGNWDGS